MIGELENWRLLADWRARAFWVRKTGWKLNRCVIGVWRVRVRVVVVRERKGVVGGAGRWTRLRRARRAKGEINWGILWCDSGVCDLSPGR